MSIDVVRYGLDSGTKMMHPFLQTLMSIQEIPWSLGRLFGVDYGIRQIGYILQSSFSIQKLSWRLGCIREQLMVDHLHEVTRLKLDHRSLYPTCLKILSHLNLCYTLMLTCPTISQICYQFNLMTLWRRQKYQQ